jgi:hypothetical protein
VNSANRFPSKVRGSFSLLCHKNDQIWQFHSGLHLVGSVRRKMDKEIYIFPIHRHYWHKRTIPVILENLSTAHVLRINVLPE